MASESTLEKIAAQHQRLREAHDEMLILSRTRARTIAVAIEEEGYTFAQIAEHLGISGEAISQIDRRGRAALGWPERQT